MTSRDSDCEQLFTLKYFYSEKEPESKFSIGFNVWKSWLVIAWWEKLTFDLRVENAPIIQKSGFRPVKQAVVGRRGKKVVFLLASSNYSSFSAILFENN